MPSLFSDHIVLQRQLPVPVRGWAEPGEEVMVTLADQTATTKADADGRWLITLQPLKEAESIVLTIQGKE